MFRPAYRKPDLINAAAICIDEGIAGDYFDGYGSYQYTLCNFTIPDIPAIPSDVFDYLSKNPNKLAFKISNNAIAVKTLDEVMA